MPRYAQLDAERVAIGFSDLSATVDAPNMILIGDGEDFSGWTYSDGTWIGPPPPPPTPARSILAGWFKAALSQMGKRSAVAAAVATMPEWKRELWASATSIREDDADVQAVATALNIDLKAVFDKAEEIRASMRG